MRGTCFVARCLEVVAVAEQLWISCCVLGGPDFSFFFFKQKTAYEIGVRLVGSEMCIRDSVTHTLTDTDRQTVRLIQQWHPVRTPI